MAHAQIILGDQLFPDKYWKSDRLIFMAEDIELCTHFKYHKHKIIFFLASMRRFASELRSAGFKIDYHSLDDKDASIPFIKKLEAWLIKKKIQTVHIYEIDDEFFEQRITRLLKRLNVELVTDQTPKFLTSRIEFKEYLESTKRPFMKVFYEKQRKKLNILMEESKPIGGKFSFDEENRKKLPKGHKIPPIKKSQSNPETEKVKKLVDQLFSDHPGKSEDFWLITSRDEAKEMVTDFFKNRIHLFGDYEDALSPNDDFLYHSVLSPYMNNGFLPPNLLLKQIPKLLSKKIPMNNVEGFTRQIMGWREFINGIYRNFNDKQESSNFFNHQRKLTRDWYEGTTGIPVLDDTIQKAKRLGYCHHIERLMVLSNFMLLCEIHPIEVHRYFMEIFVDSADWVMGPNVWGMGQFSDGGIFATKPYICGSNYIRKMSHYPQGEWCDVMDGLYWRFMEKHKEFFSKNMRMGAAMKNLTTMSEERRKTIFPAAENFIQQKTVCDH
jgi:deoxyribodipyrimidine photolyase-related protein